MNTSVLCYDRTVVCGWSDFLDFMPDRALLLLSLSQSWRAVFKIPLDSPLISTAWLFFSQTKLPEVHGEQPTPMMSRYTLVSCSSISEKISNQRTLEATKVRSELFSEFESVRWKKALCDRVDSQWLKAKETPQANKVATYPLWQLF